MRKAGTRGPSFRCVGCGVLLDAAWPFRCAEARDGDDIDHVLLPAVTPDADAAWPPPHSPLEGLSTFARYGRLLSAWALARAGGVSHDEYTRLSSDLDQAIARLDGHGFGVTPFASQEPLARRLGFEEGGGVWVKDETGNVSGSHKGRHLAGVMLYLLVAERLGLSIGRQAGSDPRAAEAERPRAGLGRRAEAPKRLADRERPPLAIASCGNAALAAAVVARAASWPLTVFVPPSAHPAVLARLAALDAHSVTCHRPPGVPGDPCYLAFKRALREGALPFCCQGSDNGLTIQGGQTIAWEMAEQLAANTAGVGLCAGPSGGRAPSSVRPPFLDAVFVQVGGGALASAVIQGLEIACGLGVIERMPRIYAVQTAGVFPLSRAYERVLHRRQAARPPGPATDGAGLCLPPPAFVDEAMSYARTHRAEFMWPWEDEPRSLAHGILDDETYDWAAVVEGMLRTGGRPVIVSEERLEEAHRAARSVTGIDVDHTGSAGLAGLMEALREDPWLRRARVAVIFSGVRRGVTS